MAARFVQIMEYSSKQPDEVARLGDEWYAATEGRNHVERLLICRDRNDPDRYLHIIEFPSWEDARANSDLPETGQIAHRLADLCTDVVTYTDLDVVDQRERHDAAR